jgi:predicted phage tail protein
MKTPLQVTAITNFIWAGEALAGAGFLLARAGSAASAAGFWALAMMSMGVSALVGGIDHGFFEPEGKTPAHRALEKAKNIAAGVIAFFALLTVGRQFFGPKAQAVFLVIACAQLGAFVVATLLLDSFLVVILDYAPAMILLLVMSLLGLASGAGSWQMVVGLVLSTAASVVQALGVDRFSPLDRNGLYHLILMAATVFLFLGGLRLAGG